VKRRALLSAVAAGSVAGCISTSRVPPRVVGINGNQVNVIICGKIIDRPCGSIDDVDKEIDYPNHISKRTGGSVSVYVEDNKLIVGGFIAGIGDPNCAGARVSRVVLANNTLSLSVKNKRKLSFSGCTEDTGAIKYRIYIKRYIDLIRRVQITHYSNSGDVILSGTVPESNWWGI
jgi:hypothetical protein